MRTAPHLPIFLFRRMIRWLALTCWLACAPALAYSVDTVNSPMSGLWWNPSQSGWGISLEQQGPVMFASWYTYDDAGHPVTYFLSNCAVSGAGCSGDIYYVGGGVPLTAPWTGHGPVQTVGSGTITFADLDHGSFSFTLNGRTGSLSLSRMQFSAPLAAGAANHTGLWWNPNESGWGATVTHQDGIMFVLLFTYDAAGNPLFYAASDCVVAGNGCSGTLYRTAGGQAPTATWSGGVGVTPVGDLTMTFNDAASGSMSFTIDGQSGSKSLTRMVFYVPSNAVPVMIDNGPLDGSGTPIGAVNMPYISVTICAPGSTTQCQTIDHIDVDTGSSGLRILSSALSSSLNLPTVTNANGNALAECLQFADGYTWGSVKQADIRIGSELASGMSIQIVGDNAFPNVPTVCSNGSSAENTVASFGANGLIGISVFREDCGPACASGTYDRMYFACPGGICQSTAVPLAKQVNNPIASFAVNNNGSVMQLPAVGAAGAATATGSLIFGIGTQANNGLGGASVYTLDPSYGTFGTSYKGVNYPYSFVDSGSNGLFFSDKSIASCSFVKGFFCPPSPLSLSAVNTGANGKSGTVNFSIANIEALSPAFSAFSNIGGDTSGLSSLSGSFDWGLPFFFGRSIYTAIEGKNAGGTQGPYVAY